MVDSRAVDSSAASDDLRLGDTPTYPPTLSVEDLEALSAIPVEVADLEDLLNYSPTDEKGVSFGMRIPEQWLVIVDTIRQRPGTNLPNLWPTRSAFGRWCMALGIRHLAKISKAIDGGAEIDPMIHALGFVERQAGMLVARAKIMTDASEHLEEIAKAVNVLLDIGEPEQAADLVNQWLLFAQQGQDEFWRRYFIKVVASNQVIRPSLEELYDSGYLEDGTLRHMLNERRAEERSLDTVNVNVRS